MKTTKSHEWVGNAIIFIAVIGLIIGFAYISNQESKTNKELAILNDEIEALESGYSCEDSLSIECDNIEQYEEELEHIAWAIAQVESGGNPKAKRGNCVGWLQISPIMVKEANRLLGSDLYYMSDRESISGSLAIFGTIMAIYNEELDLHKACRIWNPGAGSDYYNRVKNMYDLWDGGSE